MDKQGEKVFSEKFTLLDNPHWIGMSGSRYFDGDGIATRPMDIIRNGKMMEDISVGFFELFLLAVGLSMDACAVSICKGLSMKKASLKAGAICGVWFGGFQALMPLIGFYLGKTFAGAIEAFDKSDIQAITACV